MWLHDDGDGRAAIIAMGFRFGYSTVVRECQMRIIIGEQHATVIVHDGFKVVPLPRVYST